VDTGCTRKQLGTLRFVIKKTGQFIVRCTAAEKNNLLRRLLMPMSILAR